MLAEKRAPALEHVGQKIGLAFQITDDILEEVSDEKTLGKNVNSDKRNDKSTYLKVVNLDEEIFFATCTMCKQVGLLVEHGIWSKSAIETLKSRVLEPKNKIRSGIKCETCTSFKEEAVTKKCKQCFKNCELHKDMSPTQWKGNKRCHSCAQSFKP